jgi:hypothetical protein
MPLPVGSSEPLSIPATEFNEHGLAVIMLSGGRYGGDWVIGASVSADGPVLGEIRTEAGSSRPTLEPDPRYPYLAIETAFAWLRGEAGRLGLRVVGFECLNDQYGPAERPYFCLAQAIVASGEFIPAPGAVYADEMTLDAVMGYGTGVAQ